MARYCGEENSEFVLQAALDFKNKCLLGEESLFTGEKIWTPEYIDELIMHYVNNLDEGEGDFLVKLKKQLSNASHQANMLVAEMLWFMFLCPAKNMGVESKRTTIESILAWRNMPLGQNIQPYLSNEVLSGIGNPGTAFNTHRWKELSYCIHFAKAFFNLPQIKRQELLTDYIQFAKWLNAIPENETRQLRHMILYLFFPDFHERIFSTTNRKIILTTFTDITNKDYNRMQACEIDAAFLELRNTLEQEYGTKNLDYYHEPLRQRWDQSNFSTQPDEHKEALKPMNPELNQILYGPPGTGKTYATINKALEVLDPEFLELHKNERKKLKSRFDELMAISRIDFVTFHQSFSYEDFVEGLKAVTNDEAQIEYAIEDGIFKRMCDAARAKVQSGNRTDTIDIPGRTIWKMSLGNTLTDDASVYQYCIENNCILLGYGEHIDFSLANTRANVAQCYRDNGIIIEQESANWSVTSVDYIKNVMKKGDLIVASNGNYKFRAIAEVTGEYIFDGALFGTFGYGQKRPVIWHRIYEPSLPVNELCNKNFTQLSLYRLRKPTIDLVKLQTLLSKSTEGNITDNTVCQGTQIGGYTIETISDEIISVRKPQSPSLLPLPRIIINELVRLVKEQTISIGDIRNKTVFNVIENKKIKTDMEKYIVNGYPNPLAPLVERIIQNGIASTTSPFSDKRVLIIDEINRGNVSSIFGELITLIELNKRDGAEEALSVQLPYSKETFSVPSNIYIIGTMNTADKSLTQIDTALRRRFKFIEMMPDYGVLKNITIQHNDTSIDIAKLLETINQRIELLYDREHTIGHSFFLPLEKEPTLGRLKQIFSLDILPLLEEYFFEDWQRIREVLGDHLKENQKLQFVIAQYTDNELSNLMGSGWTPSDMQPYKKNPLALENPEAYIGIYERS